jgi:hypothetical protein
MPRLIAQRLLLFSPHLSEEEKTSARRRREEQKIVDLIGYRLSVIAR